MNLGRYIQLLVILGTVMLWGGASWAFDGDGKGVTSQNHWRAPGPGLLPFVQTTDVLKANNFSFGAGYDYYRKPLGVKIDGKTRWNVKRVSALEFRWAIGLMDVVQVGLAVPVNLEQYGRGAAPLVTDPEKKGAYLLADAAAGDLRLHAKVRFPGGGAVDPGKRGLGLALETSFSLPTGDEENFSGENGVMFSPNLVADFVIPYLVVSLNAGVRLRSGDRARLANVTVGNQFHGAIGAGLRLLDDRLLLAAEVDALAELSDFARSGMEIGGGVGTPLGKDRPVTLWVTGAGGLGQRDKPLLGVPQFRITVGLSYVPGGDGGDAPLY